MNRPVNRFTDRRFLLLWDQPLANPADGWNLTGGPLVAKGKVMQGIGGRGKGGAYIAGLDSETGKEAWRFYTIARPDEPGGNSWNGLPLEQRSGRSVWTAGSYDPDLNLVFFGPAPTYDRCMLKMNGIEAASIGRFRRFSVGGSAGGLTWVIKIVT